MSMCNCGRLVPDTVDGLCYGCQVKAMLARPATRRRMARDRAEAMMRGGMTPTAVERWDASLDRGSSRARVWNDYVAGRATATVAIGELGSQLAAEAGFAVRICARCRRQEILKRSAYRHIATCERCRKAACSRTHRARRRMAAMAVRSYEEAR